MSETFLLLVQTVFILLGIIVSAYTLTRLISAAHYRSKYETLLTLLNKKGHFYG